MIALLRQLWHEAVLHHDVWVDLSALKPTRRRGVVVECEDCGLRWMGRSFVHRDMGTM